MLHLCICIVQWKKKIHSAMNNDEGAEVFTLMHMHFAWIIGSFTCILYKL